MVPGTGIGWVALLGRLAGGEGEVPRCIAVRAEIGGCVLVGEGIERFAYDSCETEGPGVAVPVGERGVVPSAYRREEDGPTEAGLAE